MQTTSLRTGDAELMARIAAGDSPAFGELHDRHRGLVYSVARRSCGRHDLAEDATQEAFCALWRDAAKYRSDAGTPLAWLLTIVRNRSIDAVRRNQAVERRHALDDDRLGDLPGADRSPEEILGDRERESLLAFALARLPAPQREVIRLAYFDGLSQSEIASRLNAPLGTIKGRSRLALRRLSDEPEVAGLAL